MNEKYNKHLMHIINKVHGLIENNDITKLRNSQNQIAGILVNEKKFKFTPLEVNNIYCEWIECIKSNSAIKNSQIILYCHGGGYMSGSCLYAREITTKLAELNYCRVFCFNYRLAPENPYPAASENALMIWNYLLSCGYESQQIIIAGDSACGNLALVLTLLLKEKRLHLPKALILFSPWTDMTLSGQSYTSKELLDPILTNTYIKNAISYYIDNNFPNNPYISPVFADLSYFPPVYIQVGDNEILLDDSYMLYNKLLEYGVYAKLDVFPGMWHVFQLSPIKTAKSAIQKVHSFISNLDTF